MRPMTSSGAIECPIVQHFYFPNYGRPLQPGCMSPKIRSLQFLCYGIDKSANENKKNVSSTLGKMIKRNMGGQSLRKMIDCIAMLGWLATSLNCHHRRRCQIYCRAVRNGIASPWRMCLADVVYIQLADDPIPTFEPNHPGHRLSTKASTDGHTFV